MSLTTNRNFSGRTRNVRRIITQSSGCLWVIFFGKVFIVVLLAVFLKSIYLVLMFYRFAFYVQVGVNLYLRNNVNLIYIVDLFVIV